MEKKAWHDLGSAELLKQKELQHIVVGDIPIALSYKDGEFCAVSGECNHVKGPLGNGKLHGDYIVCPWHSWKFHRQKGEAEHPFEASCLPRHEVKVENGRVFVNLTPENERTESPHPKHPLDREVKRLPGPLRVVGISAAAMDSLNPRFSTSEYLLNNALEEAAKALKAETKLIKLNELRFKACGGFYSKDEHACTWPCTYSQMDPKDQLEQVYEALVFWADIVLIATPIRWGSASSLYYRMAERLNCIENQREVSGNVMIKNKVASFIITGGQDNVQAVAGQMLSFFGQLGFVFPPIPFIGHSRGWRAEDMEHNNEYVMASKELKDDVGGLVGRAGAMAQLLLSSGK